MTPETFFYGALCAAAFVVAAHNRHGRLTAVTAIFGGMWFWYAMTWLPMSPRALLNSLGLPLTDSQMWAFTDGVQALLIFAIGFRYWWAWTLAAVFCIQELVHDLYSRLGLYGWEQYTGLLNSLFLIQVAILMVAAFTEGDQTGVRNRIVRGPSRFRLPDVAGN